MPLYDFSLLLQYSKFTPIFHRYSRRRKLTTKMANDEIPMTGDASSDTPRQGRRNALADIFEGLTPATVHEMKQYSLHSMSKEDAERFIDRLDIIQSERFHSRRNALWDLLDLVDLDNLQNLRSRIVSESCHRDSLVTGGDTRQQIH